MWTGQEIPHGKLVLRCTGISPAVHPLLYFINKNSLVYFFFHPIRAFPGECEPLWVSPSFPAFRCRDLLGASLPHACSEDAPHTKGQDREGEPGPGVLHILGSTRWHNPAEARPDEGKQLNKETEICDCVKNVMALCPLLY